MIREVRARRQTTLDLFEQGLQRVLTFAPVGENLIRVDCASLTTWQPTPSSITMDLASLTKTLTALLERFVECARQLRPDLVGHPWFVAWLDASGDA